MWANCNNWRLLKYRLHSWIFGQTPWTDADQNLTIRTSLQTGHDAGVGTALPGNHEALPRHCCCHRHQLEQGKCCIVEWTKYNNTRRRLMQPL